MSWATFGKPGNAERCGCKSRTLPRRLFRTRRCTSGFQRARRASCFLNLVKLPDWLSLQPLITLSEFVIPTGYQFRIVRKLNINHCSVMNCIVHNINLRSKKRKQKKTSQENCVSEQSVYRRLENDILSIFYSYIFFAIHTYLSNYVINVYKIRRIHNYMLWWCGTDI